MCYEYDWMQEVNVTEETRSIAESAEKLMKEIETAPPRAAERYAEESVPA